MSEKMNETWRKVLTRRQEPIMRSSLWQVANTLVPYIALWGLMVWTLEFSYWVTLVLAVIAAGFLARLFMIFHDCAHGSFLKSPRANHLLGFVTGVLTFTPFGQWRYKHALHHATAGNLDRRGRGDIWTLTVDEYLGAPWWKRVSYRLVRNPFVLFVVAPLYYFLLHQRFPIRGVGRREQGVLLTNGALLAIVIVMSLTVGIKAYLLIQAPIILLSGMVGVWLFYVQHQFDGVYWARRPSWDFVQAALSGSSFYRLPRVLQWFTGNIGFHHIHHLSPAIPNYRLEKCHSEVQMFQQVKTIGLCSSFRSLSFRLWDERRARLVSFGQLKGLR